MSSCIVQASGAGVGRTQPCEPRRARSLAPMSATADRDAFARTMDAHALDGVVDVFVVAAYGGGGLLFDQAAAH